MESAKGNTSFGESCVDFVVDSNSAGECTAKIRELFHYVKSLSVDGDVGFNVGRASLERVGASPQSSWR